MSTIILEVAGPKNETLLFGPLSEKLRGRWAQNNVAHREKSEAMRAIAMIGDIPGECIAINTDTFEAIRFDPLRESPDGQAMWKKIEQVYADYSTEMGSKTKLREKQKYTLDADSLKTWLYCLRNALDGKLMRYTDASKSELPTLEQIQKLPGKRVRDPFNTGQQTAGDGEGKLFKFANEVKVPASYGPKESAAATT